MELECNGNMDVALVDKYSIIQTEEKCGSDWYRKLGVENAKMKLTSCGPWGGGGGCSWNDGFWYTGVREIRITCGDCIDSISVTYDLFGFSVPCRKHGGDGGSCKTVKLNWPCEYLIGISGYYACQGDNVVVRSLTFITNQRKYGPFGVETGTPFCSPINPGRKIVGFRGRSGSYLDQIGVYIA